MDTVGSVEQGTRVRASAPAPCPPAGSVVRTPGFRPLLAARMVSVTGDMCYLVGLPALILGSGGAAAQIGLLLTCYGVARLVTVLPGGLLADRIGAARMMVLSDLVRALAVLIVAVTLDGHPSTLALLAVIVLGLGEGTFAPAVRAVVPAIVPEARLSSANAIMTSGTLAMTAIAPALAGLAVHLASPRGLLFVDAASFGVSACCVLFVRCATTAGGGRTTGSVLNYVRSTPLVRSVLIATAVFALTTTGLIEVALPVLCQITPTIGASGWGVVLAGLGVGWVLGGILTPVLSQRVQHGRLVVILLVAQALLIPVLPHLKTTAAIATTTFVVGIADAMMFVVVLTVLQRAAPQRLRGRLMALVAFADFAAFPISTAVAATLVTMVPIAVVFLGFGCGLVLTAGIVVASPSLRGYDGRSDPHRGGPATTGTPADLVPDRDVGPGSTQHSDEGGAR